MIDLSADIEAIKDNCNPEMLYAHDLEVHKKVALLHGVENFQPYDREADLAPDPNLVMGINNSGVFINSEQIEIQGAEGGTCEAVIHLAKTPKGHWLMSICYQIHYTGAGSRPSIWDANGYKTREEALNAGLDQLAERAKKIAAIADSYAEGYKRQGNNLIAAIDRYRQSLNQMSLF